MRKILPFIVLAFVSASTARAQLPANDLEGTWEMISQKLVYPDSTVDRTGQVPYTLKILNSTHFAFGRQIGEEDDIFAGGGTYTYNGDTYTEHIMYHSGGLAGVSVPFDVRLEGRLWYHTGDVGDFVIEELWQRVEAAKPVARQ